MLLHYHANLKKLSLLFVLSILITSCTTSSKEEASQSTTFDEAETKIKDDINKVIKDLPPPTEVPNTIKEIGAKFHPEIVNDLNRLDSYMIDNDKAALNLGVYAADLGYLVTYNRMQESVKHIEACEKLAESLGVSTAFNMRDIQKYQDMISNQDSMVTALTQTITLTERRLESSDNLNMAALVITGGFIEGLYLAIEIVKLYPRGEISAETRDEILLPLEKLILQQEQALIDIIQLLEDIPHDDTILDILNKLNILKLLFDADKAEIAKHENEVGFHLSEKFLIDINEEVLRIREEIVE